jgi:general secretion pathway protein D
VLVAAMLLATNAGASPRRAAPKPTRSTFAFVNADVGAVADAMAAVLGHPIVVDPRVKGSLSLVTDQPVTADRATLLFTEALRGLGYSLVQTNGLYKIVPESDAKLQAEVVASLPSTAGGDRVVTQVIPLLQENAANLVPVLRPLITANNTINVNAGNNTLIITDYASNLARLDAVIAALDTPSATDVEVIPLQHAIASNLAATVLKLSESAGAGASGGAAGGNTAGATAPAGNTAVIADPALNALLVRAPNRARLAAIRALVARLDRPEASGAGAGSVHVVYLQHADATRLASVLRASLPSVDVLKGTTGGGGAATGASGGSGAGSNLPSPKSTSGSSSSSSSSSSTSSATATPLTSAAAPSTGGYIQADPASNSLIVTAPEPLFRDIRAVIDQLDVRRAQLYVESLVVEVDASRALDVGLQWKTLFNISETSLTALTLGEVASALRTISGTNILSTANVVTLDNEEARIVVGQNVPYVTGSYTTSSSSTTNPFQTVERMDVGVTLHIRPQIGPGGEIRMTVMQESSSVESTSSTQGPTTNKRSIESTVSVGDGKILVLGGLIEDSETRETDSVPGLSAIPGLGALFRSVSKTRKKTNLLVFLRPVVMHDDNQVEALSLDRYDRIRASQAALPRDLDKTLEDAPPPALPALPRPGGTPATGQ